MAQEAHGVKETRLQSPRSPTLSHHGTLYSNEQCMGWTLMVTPEYQLLHEFYFYTLPHWHNIKKISIHRNKYLHRCQCSIAYLIVLGFSSIHKDAMRDFP
jgi:hypothetical protein